MSACLFTVPIRWFDETPIKEIEEAIGYWEKTVHEFETVSGRQGNKFFGDQYSAFNTNLDRGHMYLMGCKRTTS